MPTFDTPRPVAVTLDLVVGTARLVATDRTDTVVEVRPHDPGNDADVRDAEATRVEHADGSLLIRAPRRFTLFSKGGSVDVTVLLPAGSGLHATSAMGDVQATGRLGDCRVKLSMGDIRLDATGAADLATAMGDVVVEHVRGAAEGSTGSGTVRLSRVDGRAVIKDGNGDIRVGEVAGILRVHTGNGDIVVDRARAGVDARSARGDIRLLDVAQDRVTLVTAIGGVEVGIGHGAAAWLDVGSGFGRVTSTLEPVDGPEHGVRTVEVHARTSYGDVDVHRADDPRPVA